MSTMTKIAGVPDSETAVAGMAYFAGTGPENKTCGDCKFHGYHRTRSNRQTTYHTSGCAKFKSMTGRHGPPVGNDNKSCKYFEPRETVA